MTRIIILCVVLLTLPLVGCSTPKSVTVVEYRNQLQHPETLPLPPPPGVAVRVVTKERITKGEIPDRAYVGFAYPDWVEFAKWLHNYKAYNKSLKNAVKKYQEQDHRVSQE